MTVAFTDIVAPHRRQALLQRTKIKQYYCPCITQCHLMLQNPFAYPQFPSSKHQLFPAVCVPMLDLFIYLFIINKDPYSCWKLPAASGTRRYLREFQGKFHVAESRRLLLSLIETPLLVTGEKQAFISRPADFFPRRILLRSQ